MRYVDIGIKRDDVLKKVGIETAFLGMKSGDIDKVSLGESENAIAEKLFSESVSEAAALFLRYGNLLESTEGCTISLHMPSAFPEKGENELKASVEKYLATSMLASWLRVIGDERMASYESDCATIALEVRQILNKRNKKERGVYE